MSYKNKGRFWNFMSDAGISGDLAVACLAGVLLLDVDLDAPASPPATKFLGGAPVVITVTFLFLVLWARGDDGEPVALDASDITLDTLFEVIGVLFVVLVVLFTNPFCSAIYSSRSTSLS